MPPFPPVPLVIKVELQGTVSQGVWANVLYFRYTTATAPTGADLTSFCTAIETAWAAHIAGQLSSAVTLTSVKAIDISTNTGAAGFTLVSASGSDVNNPMSANAAIVVKHFIARRYRGGHPKTFLPPPGDDQNFDASTWKSAFVANTLLAWNAFITACLVTEPSFTVTGHVNVSFFSGFTNITGPSGRARSRPTLRAVPLVDPITSNLVDTRIGSQRRRRGLN